MKNSNVLNPKNDATVNQSVITSIKKANSRKNYHRQDSHINAKDENITFDKDVTLDAIDKWFVYLKMIEDEYDEVLMRLDKPMTELSQVFDQISDSKIRTCRYYRECLIGMISYYECNNPELESNSDSGIAKHLLKIIPDMLKTYQKVEDPVEYSIFINSIRPELYVRIQNTETPSKIPIDDFPLDGQPCSGNNNDQG